MRRIGVIGLTAALALGVLPAHAATSTPAPDVAQHERWGAGFDSWAQSVLTDADGGMLVGGQFRAFDGDSTVPSRILRFDSSGELDTEFNAALGAGLAAGAIYDIVQTSDGGFLIAGSITSSGSDPDAPTNLVKRRPDGTLDTEFNANLGGGFTNSVSTVLETPDGKILVGGNMLPLFDGDEPTPRNLVRINADGTPDTAFNAALGAGLDNSVSALALTGDGKILLGGQFSSLDGAPGPRGVMRLNHDGTPDTAFNTSLGEGTGPTLGRVESVVIRPDGGMILGGEFTAFDGDTTVPQRLLALDPSGRPDDGYNARLGAGLENAVRTMHLNADGSVLVGGDFTGFLGVGGPRGIARISADGAPDLEFGRHLGVGTSSQVADLTVSATGEITLVGIFRSFDGAPPAHIARLSPVTLDVGPLEDRTDIVGAAVDVAVPVTISPARDVTTTVTGLPPGVEVDEGSGHVVGAPTEVGSWEVEVSATATLPGGPLTESARFTWTVAAPGVAPTLAGTPDVGVVGQPYSYPFTLTGDPLPQVEVTRGDLPPGLDLSPEGLLSGTPTAAGAYPLSLTATNGTAPDATLETVVRVTEAPPAAALSLMLEHDERDPGQTQTATATGYSPGEAVTFTMASTPVTLGTAEADAEGTARLEFTVPTDTTPGSHTVTATGASGEASAVFVVTGPGTPAPTPSADPGTPAPPAGLDQHGDADSSDGVLSNTGADLWVAGLAAAALASLGALALWFRRRSHQ